MGKKLLSYIHTLLITVALGVSIYLFYFHRDNVEAGAFVWQFAFITLLTDFLYVVLHLFRRTISHQDLRFDPTKLTVVIACYNGEDVIGETIENAMRHVPANQIIVVSDASTDNTARTAHAYGARVFINRRNINKAFSISTVMKWVETPYVLILDDDTLIGKTLIPTNLLDEGYSAVAFNVMPLEEPGVLNRLQRFEYRKSMFFGKNLRARIGAIGNISGAIGLYRTKDLQHQATLHSGQFGGEDQQRTALVHLYSKGRGVTYTDALVETKAPNTIKSLFRQRAFRWNLSLPELFTIYWRILLSPNQHFMLKLEKAYQMFLYITDPIRVTFIWIVVLYPWRSGILYGFYMFLSLAIWIKLRCKDPLWVVLIFPVYRHAEALCRIIAHFYWFKIKYIYMFRERFHKLVPDRNMAAEYLLVVVFIATIWVASVSQAHSKIDIIKTHWQDPTAYIPEPVGFDVTQVETFINQYVSPAVTSATEAAPETPGAAAP